jgi:hypothetical protein
MGRWPNQLRARMLNSQFCWWSCIVSWDERFAEPIVLDDGTNLATLREAIAHLAKIIPKAQCNLPEVLTASDIITKAAEQAGPIEFARITTLQAINRHVERAFDPSCKDTNQGRWRAIDDKKPPA